MKYYCFCFFVFKFFVEINEVYFSLLLDKKKEKKFSFSFSLGDGNGCFWKVKFRLFPREMLILRKAG